MSESQSGGESGEGGSNDDIAEGSVESGYGDISRHSGKGAGERASSSQPSQETGTDQSAVSNASSKDVGNAQNGGTAIRNRELVSGPPDWEWAGRAKETFAETSPMGYCPPQTDSGIPYTLARSPPVTDGLSNLGVRVRPELEQAIIQAQNDIKRAFPDDRFYGVDFYEAALTIALWHYDEVAALMAEFGYGIGD
jgi:hypothetical protein